MKTVVFDFDGVIHRGYEGYKDGTIYGEIDYNVIAFMKRLLKSYYVVISSTRRAKQIVDYLNAEPDIDITFEVFEKDFKENIVWRKKGIVGVTNQKPYGDLYINDKGYRFNRKTPTKYSLNEIDYILMNLR